MEIKQFIKELYPDLKEPELIDNLLRVGKKVRFQPGEIIIDYGKHIRQVPLVLEGIIKVIRQDDSGREIFLYHLYPGDTCAMSLSCCLSYQSSEIRAVSEEMTEILLIPVALMDQWMTNYPSWKELVIQTYQKRFQELLKTIDSIAFQKMDERLEQYLSKKFKSLKTDELHLTHKEIAQELGSTREVISRLLKQMERNGLIGLGRNKITCQSTICYAPAG